MIKYPPEHNAILETAITELESLSVTDRKRYFNNGLWQLALKIIWKLLVYSLYDYKQKVHIKL